MNLWGEWEHCVSDDVELGCSQHSNPSVGSPCETQSGVATWVVAKKKKKSTYTDSKQAKCVKYDPSVIHRWVKTKWAPQASYPVGRKCGWGLWKAAHGWDECRQRSPRRCRSSTAAPWSPQSLPGSKLHKTNEASHKRSTLVIWSQF